MEKSFVYLLVTRGGENFFLGINNQITHNNRIKIYMKRKIEEIIDNFGKKRGRFIFSRTEPYVFGKQKGKTTWKKWNISFNDCKYNVPNTETLASPQSKTMSKSDESY